MPVRRVISAERGPLLAVAALLLITAFLAAAAPATLTAAYDKAMRQALSERPDPAGAGVDLRVAGNVPATRPPGYPIGPGEIERQGERLRALQQPSLRGLTGPAQATVRTKRLRGPSGFLEVVYRPGTAERVRYVSGAPPDNPAGAKTPIQVAVAQPVAAKMKLAAGQDVTLFAGASERPLKARISGLYVPKAAADSFWADVPTLLAAGTADLGQGNVVPLAAAALDSGGFARLYQDTRLGLRLIWQMTVRPDVAAAIAPRLGKDLEAYRIGVDMSDIVPFPCEVVTDLDERLRHFTGQQRVSQAVLGLALCGLAAVTAGVLLLAGRLLGDRLAQGWSTMRARGASLPQLAAVACGVLAVAALPATVAGFVLARAALPDSAVLPSVLGVSLVLGWMLLTPLAGLVRMRRGSPVQPMRDDLVVARATPRRLAAEALVVALAAIGVMLARQRGEDQQGGLDPFVGAAPVLLAFAVGLVLLRCYPYPLRLAARLLRRGRSGVAYVAIARTARQRPATMLPMLVLLLATTVAGFATTVGSGLDRAQERAAFNIVGADMRVTKDGIDDDGVARIRKVRGVIAAAPARVINDAELTSADGRIRREVTIVAVDFDAYRKVTARSPEPPGDPAGALFSRAAHVSGTGRFKLTWAGTASVSVRRAGTVAGFPTQDPDGAFVVIPYKTLPGVYAAATTVFVRGTGIDPAAVKAAVTYGLPPSAVDEGLAGSIVQTYQATRQGLVDAPLARVVYRGFRYALLTAAGYSALAVVLTLILGAAGRGRTVAYLRTLGLSRRQARVLALVEVGPLIVTAVAAGWAVGLLLPRIVGPAVDMRPYSAGFPADLVIDPVWVPVLTAGLIALAAVAAAVDGAEHARRPLGAVLRLGEQR